MPRHQPQPEVQIQQPKLAKATNIANWGDLACMCDEWLC
jgi:hypothetical protein